MPTNSSFREENIEKIMLGLISALLNMKEEAEAILHPDDLEGFYEYYQEAWHYFDKIQDTTKDLMKNCKVHQAWDTSSEWSYPPKLTLPDGTVVDPRTIAESPDANFVKRWRAFLTS